MSMALALAIVFSGRLFNATELRHELEIRGTASTCTPTTKAPLKSAPSRSTASQNAPYGRTPLGTHFHATTDEEVLLHAWAEWGTDSVHKLDGFYALAIWSEGDRRLFLCRDRLGVKPLFYAHAGDGLLFASEPKGLLAHPDMRRTRSRRPGRGVWVGSRRTPGHGVFKGIREIRPGFFLGLIAQEPDSRGTGSWSAGRTLTIQRLPPRRSGSLSKTPFASSLQKTFRLLRCCQAGSIPA